jgi:hypothetical protein
MSELNKRISDALLVPNFVDGQVLLHTDLNEIVSVTKLGINENYYDIQKIINGETVPADSLKLAGATLSKQSEESLQNDDTKVASASQVKSYVDGKVLDLTTLITSVSGQNVALQDDIALAVNNNLYDCLSVNLTPGLWVISANALIKRATPGANTIFGLITDKTTVFASTLVYQASVENISTQVNLMAVVNLTESKTLFLQLASSLGNASALVKAQTDISSSKTATMLIVSKIK